MRTGVTWVLERLVLAQVGVLVAWAVARWIPMLDLFNHMVPHLTVAAAAGVALALVARRPGLAAALGASLLWGAYRMVPSDEAAPGEGPRTRVVVANVLTSNPDADRLLAWLAVEDPDLIGLVEVDNRWLNDLTPLHARYPHRVLRPREDNFGLAIYSKRPVWPDDPGVYADTLILAVRTVDDLLVVLVHPIPPVNAAATERRDGQLRQLGPVLQRANTVVMGDLNATPWSRDFPDTVGYRPGTWPAWLPSAARIPIDHVLVGPQVSLDTLRVGPDIGSDHLPLVADLRVGSAGRRSAQD